mmetsp:Transcript_18047/g.31929  ORF Transcript_18047/g.31929 Transcript_18047/m.31929 type:complete len:223 (-) Transcript_18047:623-1291(-)
MLGSKNRHQCSLHCFAVRPGTFSAIALHTSESLFSSTSLIRISSSSGVHGPLTSPGLSTFFQRCRHCTWLRFGTRSATSFQCFAPYFPTAAVSALSCSAVQRTPAERACIEVKGGEPNPLDWVSGDWDASVGSDSALLILSTLSWRLMLLLSTVFASDGNLNCGTFIAPLFAARSFSACRTASVRSVFSGLADSVENGLSGTAPDPEKLLLSLVALSAPALG